MLVILFESTLNSFSPVTIRQELCSISMATDEIPLMSVITDLLSNLFLNILNMLTVKAVCWDGTEMNSSLSSMQKLQIIKCPSHTILNRNNTKRKHDWMCRVEVDERFNGATITSRDIRWNFYCARVSPKTVYWLLFISVDCLVLLYRLWPRWLHSSRTAQHNFRVLVDFKLDFNGKHWCVLKSGFASSWCINYTDSEISILTVPHRMMLWSFFWNMFYSCRVMSACLQGSGTRKTGQPSRYSESAWWHPRSSQGRTRHKGRVWRPYLTSRGGVWVMPCRLTLRLPERFHLCFR